MVLPQKGVGTSRKKRDVHLSERIERRLADLETVCRKAGARVTHQRREVLRAVAETDAHPDAQAVLLRVRERMPTISFDTVYRTLSFLEERDLIRRVRATGERIRYDGNHLSHHHFICTACGKIIDFESKLLDDIELATELDGLGIAVSRQLQVFGICRDCESSKEASNG